MMTALAYLDELLTAALDYAARGWPVFPLVPYTKQPACPAHTAASCNRSDPHCRDGHTTWEQRATRDPGRIRRAWSVRPYGIGIACGPAEPAGDRHRPAQTRPTAVPAPIGDNTAVRRPVTSRPLLHPLLPSVIFRLHFHRLYSVSALSTSLLLHLSSPFPPSSSSSLLSLFFFSFSPYRHLLQTRRPSPTVDRPASGPVTPSSPPRRRPPAAGHLTVATPSGGFHRYYQAPAGVRLGNTAGKLGWLVDTRGRGGYVVAPPTRLTQHRYQLVDGYPDPVPLPDWIVRLLTGTMPQQPSSGSQSADRRPPAPSPVRRPAGYVAAALAGETAHVQAAQPGSRNHTLFCASRRPRPARRRRPGRRAHRPRPAARRLHRPRRRRRLHRRRSQRHHHLRPHPRQDPTPHPQPEESRMTTPRRSPGDVVELVDGAELLDQVEAAICAYVVLPNDHAAVAVVLWIAATHAMPAWNTAPRLVIKAPEKRCGKSRLLDLIEALCHQADADRERLTHRPSTGSIGARPDDPPTAAHRRSRHHLRTQGRRRQRRPPRPAQRRPPTRPARRSATTPACAGSTTSPPSPWPRSPASGTCPTPSKTGPSSSACAAGHPTKPSSPTGPAAMVQPSPSSKPSCTPGSAPASTSSKPPHPSCPSRTGPPTPGNRWWRSPTPPAATGPPTPAPRSSPSPSTTLDVDTVSLRVRLLIDIRTAFGEADGLRSETLVARLRDDPEAPVGHPRQERPQPQIAGRPAPRLRHPLRPVPMGRRHPSQGLQTRTVRRLLAPLLPRTQFQAPSRPSRPSVPRA